MTRRKNRTIESFDPRFIQWWIEGSRAPRAVTFPTRADAKRVRLHILYPLRTLMRQTNHYALRMAERCEAIIRPTDPTNASPSDPHDLVIQPADRGVTQYLDKAGIQLPDVPEEPDADELDFLPTGDEE